MLKSTVRGKEEHEREMSEHRGTQPAGDESPKVVAYLMSRFPKLTETFILFEILELQRIGLRVEVFPLLREHESVTHPEAQAVVDRAHYSHVLSGEAMVAQLYWLRKRPRTYVGTWWRAMRGNFRSRQFLTRALVVVPQAALLARRMQALGVTHVHAHWASHPTLAAYVVRQLAGLPYSFTAHAHDIYVERSMLDEKIRQASFVVTISDYNRRLLSDLFPEVVDKLHIIHCGIDPDVFRPPPPKQRGGPFTIVCVASLQDYKGHPYLIDACALLREQGVDFQCLLVGDGEDRPSIEDHIGRLRLSERIILMGHQARHRITEIVAEADVVALPSITTSRGKKEGIPVALMEALAMERPVVATAIAGIPELIEDGRTGVLVPERDARKLAEALHWIHANPALGRHFGEVGRAKVLQEFDLRHNSALLHALLRRDWARTAAAESLPNPSGASPPLR